jgi:hypothetical protein
MSDKGSFSKAWKKLLGRGDDGRVPSPAEKGARPATPQRKAGIERRRLPRVRALSTLYGYAVELEAKVEVREVSVGGFSAESPVEFVAGSVYTFLFSIADGTETMVRCECRHTRASQAGGTPRYIAGFQFLPNQEDSLRIIVDLYQRLRARQPELRDEL